MDWTEERVLGPEQGGPGSATLAAPCSVSPLWAWEDHFYGLFQLWDSGCGPAQAPNPGPCTLLNCGETGLCVFWGLCCAYARAELVLFLWPSGRGLGVSLMQSGFCICMLLVFAAEVEPAESVPLGWLGTVPDPLCHGQSHAGSRRQAPGIEANSNPCGWLTCACPVLNQELPQPIPSPRVTEGVRGRAGAPKAHVLSNICLRSPRSPRSSSLMKVPLPFLLP